MATDDERRIFCRWFGHKWVMTGNFTTPQHQQLSCLRCYCCVYVGDPWCSWSKAVRDGDQ